MAQLERKTKLSETSPKSQTSPTFEQLLKVEQMYRSSNSSPTFRICHDADECLSPSNYSNNNNKKSVLTKVKERAKKLKYSLSGKRRMENDSTTPHIHPTTPPWGVTLDDYTDDDDDDSKDPDPEYLGAPMYESEAAPETLKETARQHPRADPVVAESHRVPNRMDQHVALENDKSVVVSPNTTMTEAVYENLGPAYNAMSDATHMIASKLAGLAVTSKETQAEVHSGALEESSNASQIDAESSDNVGHMNPQTWDKGVSIKEYFLTKLEPGEDERALSQAITEAISPTKASRETGVVEKVKGAVSSLFWQEEITNMMKKSVSLSSSQHRQFTSTDVHSSKAHHHPATANSSPIIPFASQHHQSTSTDVHTSKAHHHPATANSSPFIPLPSQHRQSTSTNVHSSKAHHHPASANSSPIIPLSSNAYQVHEEENHGKILQTN